MSDRCLECKTRKGCPQHQGLCWSCRQDPKIKAKHPNKNNRFCPCGMRLKPGWKKEKCSACLSGKPRKVPKPGRYREQLEAIRQTAREAARIKEPWRPAEAFPGSREKITMMAARVRDKVSLYVEGDAARNLD